MLSIFEGYIVMKKKYLILVMFLALLGITNTSAARTLIKVTLLGTGVPLLNAEAFAAGGRALAGVLIEAGKERMLFDCGQGVYNRLLESGGGELNPNVGVDKVFISHLHSDHIADLATLYIMGALYRHPKATVPLSEVQSLDDYPFPTEDPLRVWGPAASQNQPVGTWSMMQDFRSAFQSDIYVRNLWDGWDASLGTKAVETLNSTKELWEGVVYSKHGVDVTAFEVDHNPVLPAYGFRVDFQGHSVVFSGDTTRTKNIITYGKDADVLIHEVYGYPEAAAPNIFAYHTSPEQAAYIFRKTKPKLAVYTHLVIPPGSSADELIARTRAGGIIKAGEDTNGNDVLDAGEDINGNGLLDPPKSTPGYHRRLEAGVDMMQILVKANGKIRVIRPETAESQNARIATTDALEVVRYKDK
jgi:ribonuclease Z